MANYQEAQQIITEAIRPRTLPLAVKFLRAGEEFPDKTRRPRVVLNKRVTVCQGVTMARVYGWTVGLTREDVVCVPALLAWGMSGADDAQEELGGLFEAVGFAGNRKVAASQAGAMICPAEGEVAGILLSPLAKAQLEPDTVVVYCNPAQAMRLVQGICYLLEREVGGLFAGKVECVDTLYAAHRLQEPRVAIPGMGDRIFSMTQDDELAVALPAGMLPQLLKGLAEAARKIGARYPVTFYQNFEPQFPPAYQALAEKLGLFRD
jgi:uncharacterized protein (DUF169 family)